MWKNTTVHFDKMIWLMGSLSCFEKHRTDCLHFEAEGHKQISGDGWVSVHMFVYPPISSQLLFELSRDQGHVGRGF